MAQQTMGVFTEEKVDALSRSLKEPDWLRAFRIDALGEFVKLPLELSPLYTKYTGISKFDPDEFSVAPPDEGRGPANSHFEGYLTGKETNVILQGNSTTIHIDLDESLSKSGLEVMSINEAISKKEGLLRGSSRTSSPSRRAKSTPRSTTPSSTPGRSYTCLGGSRSSSPLRKILLVKNPGTSIIDQSMIDAEESSKLNFLEELYTSASVQNYLVSSVLEVRAGNSSHVDASASAAPR